MEIFLYIINNIINSNLYKVFNNIFSFFFYSGDENNLINHLYLFHHY